MLFCGNMPHVDGVDESYMEFVKVEQTDQLVSNLSRKQMFERMQQQAQSQNQQVYSQSTDSDSNWHQCIM